MVPSIIVYSVDQACCGEMDNVYPGVDPTSTWMGGSVGVCQI